MGPHEPNDEEADEPGLAKSTRFWPGRVEDGAGDTPEPPSLEDVEVDPPLEYDTNGEVRPVRGRFARSLWTRTAPVVALLGVIGWTLHELGSVNTSRAPRHPLEPGAAVGPGDPKSLAGGVAPSMPELVDEPEAAPLGKNISKLLTHVDLLRVVPPEGTETVRMNRGVLPQGTVTVINLWATFCAPCKKELPELKAMFDGASDRWKGKVRFVPIQVGDQADPIFSHQQFANKMPATEAFLVDTGMGGGVRPPLEAAGVIREKAGLPITFVLDCKQSVRWHRTKVLSATDLADLEALLDELHAELGKSYCRVKKPAVKRPSGAPDEVVEDTRDEPEEQPPPPPEAAPEPTAPEKNTARRPAPAPRCGDDVCDPRREDCHCPECSCEQGKCTARPDGSHFCKLEAEEML